MALKALMLRKRIDEKKKALEELRSVDFAKREAEIEESIAEATTDEEKTAVEEEIEKFDGEKKENEEAINALTEEVEKLEEELAGIEEEKPAEKEERKAEIKMEIRDNATIYDREDVKAFLGEVRTCIKEKRALSNVGLTIPTVMLPMIKEAAEVASKLIGKVNRITVNGTSRQVIMGTIPEAVWTEMCANLNELSLGFNDIEIDGYKVGGYFAVCNAILDDNDVNLAGQIVDALGKSIGKALDKAILYGTGTKMPLGIVTRLAQTQQPADYLPTARPWVDLHTTNVITGSGATGLALFKEIVGNSAVAINKYSNGGLFWVMNEKTRTSLLVQSMDKNMNAAVVAGVGSAMPVVGGEIIVVNDVPDDNIVFGYGELYTLVERAGTKIEQSEHVRFTADQTVFKGTARYDGQPVIAEAFGVMTITTAAPTTQVTFPSDTAN